MMNQQVSHIDRNPEGICGNCLATRRAAKPQPAAVHCHHRHAVAWPTLKGWRTDRATDATVKRLRVQGYL
jgi:hypothetical protein